MKKIIFIVLIIMSGSGFAQKADTWHIEDLTPPKKICYELASPAIFTFMFANPVKTSPLPDSLAYFGQHPFLSGILTAYKEHRPFVLSPDMMWLLISQGLSRHVVNNPEVFRKAFKLSAGKKNLTVVASDIYLGNPQSPWEEVFPQFISQINKYTGKEMSQMLQADFSTTTPTTRIVSQITIMETVKPFFNYKVMMIGCGIPDITIEGTVQDWEKVLAKTRYIAKFDLKWWTSELIPIIQKIIDTKKGKFDRTFWMNMVKAHTEKKYGSPTTINGWIIKFFPYTKSGAKSGLIPVTNINNLAPELVKVPFVFIDKIRQKNYNMEFWGGFIGLSQNRTNFTMKPEIGWCIHNANEFNPKKSEFSPNQEMDNLSVTKIDTIPDDIYMFAKIDNLHLEFLNRINISERLTKVAISKLDLTGKISPEEIVQIKKMFPNTSIIINNEAVQTVLKPASKAKQKRNLIIVEGL